jgi:hypothetical protein
MRNLTAAGLLKSPSVPLETVRNSRNLIGVMLSKAKHLAFSAGYEVEILRLRLRMTLRHSFFVKGGIFASGL